MNRILNPRKTTILKDPHSGSLGKSAGSKGPAEQVRSNERVKARILSFLFLYFLLILLISSFYGFFVFSLSLIRFFVTFLLYFLSFEYHFFCNIPFTSMSSFCDFFLNFCIFFLCFLLKISTSFSYSRLINYATLKDIPLSTHFIELFLSSCRRFSVI